MTIEAEFRSQGMLRGGILMLDASGAMAMVQRAHDLGVAVLGLDGFWITEDTTQPDIGHTIDLSDRPEPWSDAIRFIEERMSSGLKFEVVLDEDDAAP